jgi:ATP-binding cassette, subfamily C, bacteriocin exporter
VPRLKLIRQHDISDCGAACLASVASYHGLHLPLAQIRDYSSTCKSGTNVLGLIEAAEKIGMTAKGVKGPFDALSTAPLPSIAHVITTSGTQHYVVLSSIGKKHIHYMDPTEGKIVSAPHEEFTKMWTGVLVIIAPGSGFEKGNKVKSKIYRLIRLVLPFKSVIIQALAGSVVYSLLGLSTAIYVQKIMDYVLVNQNISLLNLMSLAMILILILRNVIGYLKNLFLLKTGHHIDSGLLMGYYRHLLNLPQRFFDNMKTGEILSRMGDAIKIRNFINQSFIDLTVSLASVVLTVLAMSILSTNLCLLVASSIPLYALIFYLYDRVNRVILRRTMEKAADLESQIVESVSLSRLVREFSLHTFFLENTESHFIGFLQSTYRSGRASIRSGQASELISGLLTILLLWVGANLVSKQSLTPGELMSFYAMLGYLIGPVARLTSSSRSFRDAGVAADRLFQILDLEAEKYRDKGMQIQKINKGLEFRDVDFRYGSRPLLFNNMDLTISAGTFTGIAGENGCGKSSLASLLLALYDPMKGKIIIDGLDINLLNKDDLRNIISIVPQHLDLFSGTLLDNIAPGESNPDLRKIYELVNKTGFSHLLEKFPEEIMTRIGERGLSLSGGERQKIAIIRALYRNPSVLIMDEGTSALDPLSEQKIITLLKDNLKKGLTLIMISHKLRSIQYADQIVFISNGRVAEQGTHYELMNIGGIYHQYWELQNNN